MPVPANWRWLWEDDLLVESWRMPRNPSAMTSPLKGHQTESLGRIQDARPISMRRADAPAEWRFSGKVRDSAFEATLLDWLGRDRLLWITDHFGRRFLTKTQAYSIVPARTGRTDIVDYYATYEVTTLVLELDA